VRSLVFLPGGKRLVSGSFDQTVRFWDVSTGKEVEQLPRFEKEVLRIACSPDGKLLAVVVHGDTIRLWDLERRKEVRSFNGDYPVFSPDGRKIACADGKRVQLRETATGKLLHSFMGHTDDIWALAFSPDGKSLASGQLGQDATVRLWEISSGKELSRWP